MAKENNKEHVGLFIPPEILRTKDLTMREKMVFSEIIQLHNVGGCSALRKHFADRFGISKTRVTQITTSLREKKMILVDVTRDGKRIIKRIITPLANLTPPVRKPNGGGVSKVQHPYKESLAPLQRSCRENIHNNIHNNLQKDIHSKTSEKVKGSKANPEALFPEKLNTPAFSAKWGEWIKYRKEMRKTLTASTIKKQLRRLTKFSVSNAIKAIDESIEKGWTGLFPKDQNEKVSNNGQRSKTTIQHTGTDGGGPAKPFIR